MAVINSNYMEGIASGGAKSPCHLTLFKQSNVPKFQSYGLVLSPTSRRQIALRNAVSSWQMLN